MGRSRAVPGLALLPAHPTAPSWLLTAHAPPGGRSPRACRSVGLPPARGIIYFPGVGARAGGWQGPAGGPAASVRGRLCAVPVAACWGGSQGAALGWWLCPRPRRRILLLPSRFLEQHRSTPGCQLPASLWPAARVGCPLLLEAAPGGVTHTDVLPRGVQPVGTKHAAVPLLPR